MIPAPIVGGVALRYLAVRIGAFVGRKAVTTYGKKTAAKRMQQEAAKRGGKALAPAPQGPLGYLGLIQLESRGGEHTSRSRTPKTRKSIRGPSAQKGRSRPSSKKPGRRIPLADRRGPATSRERRPRAAKWCRTHKRYDYCYMR